MRAKTRRRNPYTPIGTGKVPNSDATIHIAEQPMWGVLIYRNEHEFSMDESLHTNRECVVEDEARTHIQEVNPQLYRRLYG